MSRNLSAPGLRLCGAFDQGLIAAQVQGSAVQAATSAAPGQPYLSPGSQSHPRHLNLTASHSADDQAIPENDADLIASGTDVLVNLSLYIGPSAEAPFGQPAPGHRPIKSHSKSASMDHLEAVLDGMQRSIDTLRDDVSSLRFPVELVASGAGQFDDPFDGPRRPAA